ncbi:MAG: SDR family NAD(P)-dependent oxidoreductase [Bacteroides sp.]|nr:SDR family NAD(P)-dependent oxidoreductase [Bacteroides sp.]
MKRIIIIGASSGMGMRVAADFARMGWRVGVAARRIGLLRELAAEYPGHMECMELDVTAADAADRLDRLIALTGGMDIMLYAAGCGWYNPDLDPADDDRTVAVNVAGFTRICDAAYSYYRRTGHPGRIAAITSVAGTRGLGVSATYSASKRYQWTYLQALGQLARIDGLDVGITDIRPGFVRTALLARFARPLPLEMSVDSVAPRIESALLRGRRVAVIDSRWAILTALWRLLPRPLWQRLLVTFRDA